MSYRFPSATIAASFTDGDRDMRCFVALIFLMASGVVVANEKLFVSLQLGSCPHLQLFSLKAMLM